MTIGTRKTGTAGWSSEDRKRWSSDLASALLTATLLDQLRKPSPSSRTAEQSSSSATPAPKPAPSRAPARRLPPSRYLVHVSVTVLCVAVLSLVPSNVSSASKRLGPLSGMGQRLRGHVVPGRELELKPPVDEIVGAIMVDEGDRVREGQMLARLNGSVQEAIVETARLRAESEALVQRTAVDLRDAESHLKRLARAHGRAAATDSELERAQLAVQRAAAVHAEARDTQAIAVAALALEQRRLDRYRLVAPFDGVILRIDAEAGEMLTTEQPVLVVADLRVLEAHINLPAQMYGELEIGAAYGLSADEPVSETLTGTLKWTDSVIDAASQSFRAVFEIENAGMTLPAGFSVTLEPLNASPPTVADVPPDTVAP